MFESIGFTLSQLELWLLIFVRFLTLLSTFPFFSYDSIDPRVRAFFAVLLATLMARIIPYPDNFPIEFTMLMFYVAREVLIGFCIGMFSAFFVEVVKFAGTQTSHMMGLNMASMVDPTTSEESEAMPELFNFIAVLLIISINGHHFFLKILLESFYMIPINQLTLPSQLVPEMLNIVSNIIIIGIRLSAPIVISVFLIRIIVGFLNKLVQEADVFSIIMVVNILIGLIILNYYWVYFTQITNELYYLTQEKILTIMKLLGSNI